jgi:tetratricopeptide (TPR) repeat protein
MPDTPRIEPTADPDGLSVAERDTRIEQLLLAGLDHYFAGEYERAISAWTRVLFLDRSHARARAYIERARGAIGERQRESDELLHHGVDAFNRGETEEARRLLTSAVERGGSQEVAQAFLERLVRLDRPRVGPAATKPGGPSVRRVEEPAAAARERRRTAWALPVVILGIIVVALFYIQGSRERTAPFLFLIDRSGGGATSAVRPTEEALPVPRSAEIDLDRARILLAQGHPRDALQILDRIGPQDPSRAEAAALREEVQRELLSEYLGAPAPRPPVQPPGQPHESDRHP